MMLTYLLEVTPDDNGTLLVTCPAFPEVTTFAEDQAQVWLHAMGAIEEAIAARIDDGEPLPKPASEAQIKRHRGAWVKMPTLTALKAFLYMALRESGVTRAELARQLGWHREQVDRLFRLHHASRVDQIEAAFAALHQDVDVRVRAQKTA
jgi:antitoxin HicB